MDWVREMHNERVNQKPWASLLAGAGLVGLGLAVVALMALTVSAAAGTGQEIQVDAADQAASKAGVDQLRLAATSTNTGSLAGAGDLTLHVKVNTFDAAGLPRKPIASDFSGSTPSPNWFWVSFVSQHNGQCFIVNPEFTPATMTWDNPSNLVVGQSCTAGNPGTHAFSCPPSQCWTNVQASWVCNEVKIVIPRDDLWLTNPPGAPPDNTDLDFLESTSGPGGWDYMPLAASSAYVGTYTLGQQGASPRLGMLSGSYTANPDKVALSWSAPPGGNTATGYRVERRDYPSGSWEYLTSALTDTVVPLADRLSAFGPSLAPQLSFQEPTVPPQGQYEYRVTPLRCNDTSLWNTADARTVIVDVPELPPPLTANFVLEPPRGLCGNLPVPFYDMSTGPETIVAWQWRIDNVVVSTQSSFEHTFTTSGDHTVELTVTDDDIPVATDTLTQSVFVPPYVNCCPDLDPLDHVTVQAGSIVALLLTGSDLDGDPLSFAVEGYLPGQPSMNSASGSFKWTTPEKGGRFPVVASVYDGQCATTRTLTIMAIPLDGDKVDSDSDGIPDYSDNCAGVANHNQLNADADAEGDLCDLTPCGPGSAEGCVADLSYNPQLDLLAVRDSDNDGIADRGDSCPDVANFNQADRDGDIIGDLCDRDVDGDSVVDTMDNCPVDANPDQKDFDEDGIGNMCRAPIGADGEELVAHQGSLARNQEVGLAEKMQRVGGGVLAFVAVGVLSLLFIRRLRAK